jgi:DnaJ-class molecular chaperone
MQPISETGWHLCPKCDGYRTIGRWDCPACDGSGIKEATCVSTNPRPKEKG